MRISSAVSALFLLPAIAAFGAAPTIQSVANAANYQPGIASATWVAIFGSNLASSTRQWSGGDFVNGNLPTKLDDVQVSINGQAAFVYFISPGQIDVLAPDDAATGQVAVIVTNSGGSSSPFMVNKQAVAPALFAYSQGGGNYAVVQEAGNYALVAPAGLLGSTVQTVQAAPGDSVILYATGLGPVSPAQPSGQVVGSPAPTATPVQVTVANQPATVQFAGIIGPGLYQLNIVVPSGASGDVPVVVTISGESAESALMSVQASTGGQKIAGCVSGQVDSITYSVGELYYGLADDVSIGGTELCATCKVKPPLYAQFDARLERALRAKKNVQACYDENGSVFQLKVANP